MNQRTSTKYKINHVGCRDVEKKQEGSYRRTMARDKYSVSFTHPINYV